MWPGPAQSLFCTLRTKFGSREVAASSPSPHSNAKVIVRELQNVFFFNVGISPQNPDFQAFKKKKINMMILPILATFLNDKCQQPIAPRGLSTVFINKILFKHSHSHSFMYRLWLLSLRSSSVDSAAGTRDHGAEKYFQSDSLQKRFADPWGGSSQLCLHHSCPQYFRIQVQ